MSIVTKKKSAQSAHQDNIKQSNTTKKDESKRQDIDKKKGKSYWR